MEFLGKIWKEDFEPGTLIAVILATKEMKSGLRAQLDLIPVE